MQELPFDVADDNVTDLPPLDMPQDVREKLEADNRAGAQDSTSAPAPAQGPEEMDPDTLKMVFEMLFKGGYLYYGEGHEHWLDDAHDEEIAFLVPRAIKWGSRWPALVTAVNTVDMEAFPIMALYIYGKNVIKSERIKKQQREATEHAGMQTGARAQQEPSSGGRNHVFNVPL